LRADVEEQDTRREQWLLLTEIWLTIFATAALLPILLDLWAATFSEVAARMEHGLALAVIWPIEQLREQGFLPRAGESLDVRMPLGICAIVALLLTTVAGLIDPKPGTRPGWMRRLLALPWVLTIGPPALIAALAVVFLGVALDPLLFCTLLSLGLLGSLLGRRRRRDPIAFERSLSGLPPAFWKTDHLVRYTMLFLALSTGVLLAAVGALPWDEAPLELFVAMDERTGWAGVDALPWCYGLAIVLGLILNPPTRRALELMTWEPWTSSAIGGVGAGLVLTLLRGPSAGHAALPLGFALGLLGTLMSGSGVPWLPRLSLHPVRAVGRLGLPIAAALAVGIHVLTVGFLGCEDLDLDPRITRITTQAGAIDIAYARGETPGILAAFRAESYVVRLALDGSSAFVIEGSNLPLRALDAKGARVRPVGFGEGGRGQIFLLVEVERPDDHTTTALIELDPADAGILAIAEDDQPCGAATFGWNPVLNVGVVGCRDVGQVLLYEAYLKQFIAHETLTGTKEIQSLAIDPVDGSMLSLARRASPFLVRLDLRTRRPVAWQFLGMGNVDLHLDEFGGLHVARFLGRQVLSLDTETLRPLRARPAGFAIQGLEEAPMHDRIITASVMDGHLYAVDIVGQEPTRRLKVGGLVHSLTVSPSGRTLYAAGLCGVMSVDLNRWLKD
jgi:hypothetical protein